MGVRKQYNPKKYYRDMNHDKADEVRRLYFSREMTQKQLAAKFQISQSAVCRIVSGWTWVKNNAP